MNTLDRSAAEYLKQIEELLADIGEEDRASLLADLAEQLSDAPGSQVTARLGTPEEFVNEYRRSAGIDPTENRESHSATMVQNLLSGLLLPFGALVLLSFGGQVLLGPFVIAIEWILARISPRPLRIAWSILAGALVGEIAFLVLGANVPALEGIPAGAIGLIAGSLGGVLIYRTSQGPKPPFGRGRGR